VACGTTSRNNCKRFWPEIGDEDVDTGGIATRLVERFDKAKSDRIGSDAKDNRNRLGRRLCRQRGTRVHRDEHGRAFAD